MRPAFAILPTSLLFVLVVVGGCTSPDSNCDRDADCILGERCVTGGGIFFTGGRCVPTDEADAPVADVIPDTTAPDTDNPDSDTDDSGPAARDTRMTSCTPKTCTEVGAECGKPKDGCGGTLDCGTCTGDLNCTADFRCKCDPKSCTQLGAECGEPDDGCGGTLDCGTCKPTENCDKKTYTCECEPKTCKQVGAECGTPGDGCGGTLDCGGCGFWADCTSFQCNCERRTCADFANQCGTFKDGCGGQLDCTEQTCDSSQCAFRCGPSNSCKRLCRQGRWSQCTCL